jgi:hypothetical protein
MATVRSGLDCAARLVEPENGLAFWLVAGGENGGRGPDTFIRTVEAEPRRCCRLAAVATAVGRSLRPNTTCPSMCASDGPLAIAPRLPAVPAAHNRPCQQRPR